jgi:hypothetical protein
MNFAVHDLVARYPEDERAFVFPTTKDAALAYLERLARVIREMEDVDRFPERAPGVELAAIMHQAAICPPDVGDFGDRRRGIERLVGVTFAVFARSIT